MNDLQEIVRIGFYEGLTWFPIVLACGIIYKYLKSIDISIDGIIVIAAIIFTITYNQTSSLILAFLATAGGCMLGYLVVSFLQQQLQINSILSGIILTLALHSISVIWIGESLHLQYQELSFLQQPFTLILLAVLIAIAVECFFRTSVGIRLRVSSDNPQANVRGNPKVHRLFIFMIAALVLSFGVLLYTARSGQARAGGGFEFLITALSSFLFTDRIIDLAVRILKKDNDKYSYRQYVFYSILQGPVVKALLGSILFQIVVLLIIYYTSDPAYWKLFFACILIVLVSSPSSNFRLRKPRDCSSNEGLDVKNISLAYDNGYEKRQVFMDLGYHFENGLHIIWGNNGEGKTSFLRMIYGDLHPDKGSISMNGTDITYASRQKRNVFYIAQRPHDSLSTGSTVFENIVAVSNAVSGLPTAGSVLQDSLSREYGKKTRIGVQQAAKLSGGQAQKLNLLLCAISGSSLILADEPTSGMDTVNLEIFKTALFDLEQRKVVTIIATHDERLKDLKANHIRLENHHLTKIN